MKRLSVSVLVVLVLGLAFSRADASVTVTANFTADNVVAALPRWCDPGFPID